MSSEEIKTVLAKIVKYFPEQQADQIEFVLIASLNDKYGNSSDHPIIGLPFDMEDIKKINFENVQFTNWDLLKLAKPADFLHPAGRKIVYAFCQEENSIKYTGNFCPASLGQ